MSPYPIQVWLSAVSDRIVLILHVSSIIMIDAVFAWMTSTGMFISWYYYITQQQRLQLELEFKR